MAEAMCGPSNALQQFKQTTSLDRSLQQDRFGSRRHQAQGFRSANANAGMLDPEFEAFQQGRSVTPVLDHAPVFPAASRFAAPSQLPSWADDFQRMAISPASHMQQSQPQPQAQLFPASAGASSWAQGFREQMNAPRASSPSPLAFQQMARYGATGYSSSFTPQPAFAPEMQSAKGKEPMVDAFDEAAFERAFDMAREDMMADEEVETQGLTAESVLNAVDTTTAQPQLDQDMPVFKAEDIFADIKDLPQVEQVPVMQQEQPIEETVMEQPAHDDDALAATAQELLHKVEHNQSDKFKNSQFLGLMRKLADRQVRVEGDKMVETADATANSIAAGAPLNAPLSSDSRYIPGVSRPVDRMAAGTLPADLGSEALRQAEAQDGQDVVNLLNDPNLAEEIGPYAIPRTATEDVGTFPVATAAATPGAVIDEDGEEAWPSSTPAAQKWNASLSDMLYGPNGTLSR